MIPVHNRFEQSVKTLNNIIRFADVNAEILVFFNEASSKLKLELPRLFPDIRYLHSDKNLGPGGARSQMLSASSYPIVFSFDDDSYPIDDHFFEQVFKAINDCPDIGIFVFNVFHRGELVPVATGQQQPVRDFIGCACAYRKSLLPHNFEYVPLPCAYGMEETDLSIQYFATGGKILWLKGFTVFHDTDLQRHSSANNNLHSIKNLILLCYLRFPVTLWPLGLFKVLSRTFWLMTKGRFAGLVNGYITAPAYCRQYARFRKTLPASTVLRFFRS